MEGAEKFLEWLKYASGPGVGYIAGLVSTMLLEDWAWYQDRTPKQKVFLSLCLHLAVPLLAVVIMVALGVAASVDLFFLAAAAGVVAYLSSTGTHAAAKQQAAAMCAKLE